MIAQVLFALGVLGLPSAQGFMEEFWETSPLVLGVYRETDAALGELDYRGWSLGGGLKWTGSGSGWNPPGNGSFSTDIAGTVNWGPVLGTLETWTALPWDGFGGIVSAGITLRGEWGIMAGGNDPGRMILEAEGKRLGWVQEQNLGTLGIQALKAYFRWESSWNREAFLRQCHDRDAAILKELLAGSVHISVQELMDAKLAEGTSAGRLTQACWERSLALESCRFFVPGFVEGPPLPLPPAWLEIPSASSPGAGIALRVQTQAYNRDNWAQKLKESAAGPRLRAWAGGSLRGYSEPEGRGVIGTFENGWGTWDFGVELRTGFPLPASGEDLRRVQFQEAGSRLEQELVQTQGNLKKEAVYMEELEERYTDAKLLAEAVRAAGDKVSPRTLDSAWRKATEAGLNLEEQRRRLALLILEYRLASGQPLVPKGEKP